MAKYINVILKLPPSVYKLIAFAKMVLAAMLANPLLANPSPSLVVLDKRIKALEDALSKGTTAERRAAHEALRGTLKHLADFVQTVAEEQSGSPDLLAIQALVESAGMQLRKIGAHAKNVLAVRYGPVPGSVELTAPASPQRDTHDWQSSTDQISWTGLPSTRRAKTQVTGLPIGMAQHFRHRLLTKDGYTEWSDPVLTIVVK